MVHAKQFLLTESAFPNGTLTEAWDMQLLPCGWTLTWDPQVGLKHSKDWSVVLLGTAWQVDPDKDSDIQNLVELACGMDLDAIVNMISSWCGRFLLIADGKVYMDCNGLFGVFYADGALSCSTPILCDHLGIKVKKPKIAHSVAPDFMPGERTQYPQIRRLLLDQIYDLRTKKQLRKNLLPGGVVSFETTEERDQYLFRCFTESLRNFARTMGDDKEILIALTGGVDSRTTLALAEQSGIDYSCFTLEHDEISAADRKIPPVLCRLINRKFRYIPRAKADPEKLKEFDCHCGGMSVDTDRQFYGRGQYQALTEGGKKKVAVLRSSIWERFFGGYIFHLPVEERKHMTRESFLKFYRFLSFDDAKQQSFYDWLDRIHGQEVWEDESCMTELDRMYLTMRSGCWLTDVEQSLLLIDNFECYQVLNCTLLFRILYGYVDPNDRPDNKLEERRLTKLACPVLAKVPYESDYTHVMCRREKAARYHRTNRRLFYLYGPRPVLSRYKARVKSSVKKMLHH